MLITNKSMIFCLLKKYFTAPQNQQRENLAQNRSHCVNLGVLCLISSCSHKKVNSQQIDTSENDDMEICKMIRSLVKAKFVK